MKRAALAGLTAAALLLAPAAALAQTPTPTPTPVAPPSILQLCLATGIEEVDDLLDGVAKTDLLGELSPLLTLLVPTSDTAELDASVQLEDVRQRLNCAPTPGPTSPAPTTAPGPTTAPDAGDDEDRDRDRDRDDDSDDFDQVERVPRGGVDTGAP